MLRVALPNKGRLMQDAHDVLEDAGLGVRAAGPRALTASLGGEFEAIFARAADIPELVADGIAQAGVTGWDLCAESGREVSELLDLEFGRCRLVLASREDSAIGTLEDLRRAGRQRVATVFSKIAERYFRENGVNVDLVPVSGATEIAPHLGIADVVVDLTSTGSTLRTNGLREIATVMESSARLIGSVDPTDETAATLAELAGALESVLRARGRRYLMANIPRVALDEIRRILPGLNGPTVVDVLGPCDKVAVHAVVEASGIFRTIARLRALGAEGILITRIERLMA
jgi:ATP phosphoribosyltransferase